MPQSLVGWREPNCFFSSMTKSLENIAFMSNIFALLRSDREYLNVGDTVGGLLLTNNTGGSLWCLLGCASVSSRIIM